MDAGVQERHAKAAKTRTLFLSHLLFLNTAEKMQKRCMYTFLSFCSLESESPTISICSGAGRRDAGCDAQQTVNVAMSPVREYRAIPLWPFVP